MKQQSLPAVLVDGGNLLFNKLSIFSQPSQKTITAEGILSIYKSMGIAGVGVGPYDLAAGVDFLLKEHNKGFPWLSANLLDKQNRTIFQPSRIQNAGRFRIGIIGLTGKPAKKLKDTFNLVPYQDVLQQEINKLSHRSDFIILLSSLTKKENEQIGRDFASINIIISTDGNAGNDKPRLINNSLVSQTVSRGKYQGLLTITLGENAKWTSNNDQQLAALKNRLGSYDWQLKRMKKREELHTPNYLDKIAKIEQKRKELSAKITSLKEKITLEKNNAQSYSTYIPQFLAIKKSIPQDPDTHMALINIKDKIKYFNKKLRERRTGLSLKGEKAHSQYVGFHVCEECHEQQSQFWQTTAHANSYETLVKKDMNFNLDCLGCHITLSTNPEMLREADKKKLLQLPSSLQLVGCESCHGQGSAHSDNPEAVKPIPVSRHTCLHCHTEEHSESFDYDKKVEKIRCPADETESTKSNYQNLKL